MHYPTLTPGELFTVQEYQYTKFRMGSDRWSVEQRGQTTDSNDIWAFPLAAAITAWRVEPEPVTGPHLSFGDIVEVPGYGTYRILRDHNRNVKFERVAE